eukprot:TRINITY_DN17547_c2_g1_i2.p1 TRINITY_DN17547_c2_g1~~TRINITY_DN17547_c2_g1_i2.p1  ORF type:complete len:470 (-),score=39.13 TRINITY_DN17547_c2_g1_i2:90-1499(-)
MSSMANGQRLATQLLLLVGVLALLAVIFQTNTPGPDADPVASRMLQTSDVAAESELAGHPCKFCPPETPWSNETNLIERTLSSLGGVIAEINYPRAEIFIHSAHTFEHWGSSLAWWAAGVGQWKDLLLLNSMLDLIYSDFSHDDLLQRLSNGQGVPPTLGLTQARYNIGGTPKKPLNDPGSFYRPGAAVESFLDEAGTWHWDADFGQRRVLALALMRGVSSVQAFANSPPWWMTKTQNTTGAYAYEVDGHPIKASGKNMADENITEFASYLADVCYQFATDKEMLFGRTYTFDSLSPLNEPGSVWWIYGNNQEGCHFSYRQQALVVDAVKDELVRRSETSRIAVAAAEGNKVFQTSRAMLTFNKSAETMQNLDLVTTHQYSFLVGKDYVGGVAPEYQLLHQQAQNAGKDLWVSEFGTGAGPLQGGLRLGKRIISALLDLKPSTWTLWQVASLHNDLSQEGWAQIVARTP